MLPIKVTTRLLIASITVLVMMGCPEPDKVADDFAATFAAVHGVVIVAAGITLRVVRPSRVIQLMGVGVLQAGQSGNRTNHQDPADEKHF